MRKSWRERPRLVNDGRLLATIDNWEGTDRITPAAGAYVMLPLGRGTGLGEKAAG